MRQMSNLIKKTEILEKDNGGQDSINNSTKNYRS